MTEAMWSDEIFSVQEERGKGHVRVHASAKQTSASSEFFKPRLDGGKQIFQDSWRGNGPFAQYARSVILDDQMGIRRNAPYFIDELFTAEIPTNTPQVTTRRIKPLKPGDPGISNGEICLFLQKDPSSTNVIEMEDCSLMQDNAVCMLSVGQWNKAVVNEQRKLWHKNEGEYMRLTPREVFSGWKVEGIMMQDDLSSRRLEDRNRVVTIVVRNRVGCKAYWRSARPGSRCFMVIKKHEREEKLPQEKMGEDGVMRMIPLMPFSIGFYTATYGEPIPVELYHYVDEYGFPHHDALVIEMGSVMATSMGPANSMFAAVEEQRCECYHGDMERQGVEEYTMLQLLVDIKEW
jgi:hypothetical protein